MSHKPHIKDGFFFSEDGERISVNIIGAIVRRGGRAPEGFAEAARKSKNASLEILGAAAASQEMDETPAKTAEIKPRSSE